MNRMSYGAVLALMWTLGSPRSASSADREASPSSISTHTRFAIVIGYNGRLDDLRPPLHYADDDAIKNAELLRELGMTPILLTELDAASRETFTSVSARPPTLAAFSDEMEGFRAEIERAHEAGRRAIFYLFYSGHGDVENNEGFVFLEDGRLYRSDLIEAITNLKADVVHVVIDACKAYYMAFSRGPDGERSPVDGRFVRSRSALPPEVGLLLASSADQDSHEWAAYRAGVFSHELRSALRGGADLDGDGRITYEEAGAFIYAANKSVPLPKYRPSFFVQSPKGDATIVDLTLARGGRLVIGPRANLHYFLEDARGERIFDVHPASEIRLALLLPPLRPLFLHAPTREREYEISSNESPIELEDLVGRPRVLFTRGAAHLAFEALFQEPLVSEDLAAFQSAQVRARREFLALESERTRRLWSRGLQIAALSFAGTGGVMTGLAAHSKSSVTDEASQVEIGGINVKVSRLNALAIVFYGAAAASALVSALVALGGEDGGNRGAEPMGDMEGLRP